MSPDSRYTHFRYCFSFHRLTALLFPSYSRLRFLARKAFRRHSQQELPPRVLHSHSPRIIGSLQTPNTLHLLLNVATLSVEAIQQLYFPHGLSCARWGNPTLRNFPSSDTIFISGVIYALHVMRHYYVSGNIISAFSESPYTWEAAKSGTS